MDKNIQRQINQKCVLAYESAVEEYFNGYKQRLGQLRHCSAEVFESENYIFLRSYNTMIAFIDKKDSVLYDVLRYVYGYTATSAQHISKFSHDYYNHIQWRYYPC